jgi:hypothetical protein
MKAKEAAFVQFISKISTPAAQIQTAFYHSPRRALDTTRGPAKAFRIVAQTLRSRFYVSPIITRLLS